MRVSGSESLVLAEWVENECRHLDLIASWEVLLGVYDVLGFMGPDSDDERLEEFKTIIGELNKFLTRMKNGLAHAASVESAVEYLRSHRNTADMSNVRNRASVAYNKLKQRWISQAITTLLAALPTEKEEGEEADGR